MSFSLLTLPIWFVCYRLERYTEIERENRILLEKMTNILQNPKGISNANAQMSTLGAGPAQPFGSTSMPQMSGSGANFYQRKSLNREARNREYKKITHENALILKRLQEKQPNYNVTRWAKEDMSRRKILSNICEFPYQFQARQEGEGSTYMNGPPDFIIKKKNRTQY